MSYLELPEKFYGDFMLITYLGCVPQKCVLDLCCCHTKRRIGGQCLFFWDDTDHRFVIYTLNRSYVPVDVVPKTKIGGAQRFTFALTCIS